MGCLILGSEMMKSCLLGSLLSESEWMEEQSVVPEVQKLHCLMVQAQLRNVATKMYLLRSVKSTLGDSQSTPVLLQLEGRTGLFPVHRLSSIL